MGKKLYRQREQRRKRNDEEREREREMMEKESMFVCVMRAYGYLPQRALAREPTTPSERLEITRPCIKRRNIPVSGFGQQP